MNLTHLRYFVELAHSRSYAVAAERMLTTQPNISYAVTQLENELGVTLVIKTGRTNQLTAYGKQFLKYAEGTLKTLDSGVNAIHRSVQDHTVIRLGFLRYLGSEYLPQLVVGFQKEFSDYNIEFEFETSNSAGLHEAMAANRLDVICCAHINEKYKEHGVIYHQKFSLIVPPGHPLANEEKVTLKDTMKYPYIYYVKNNGIRNVIEPYIKAAGGMPEIKYELQEERVVAGFVSAGMGIAIVPHGTLSSRVNVVEIDLDDVNMGRDIHMILTDSQDVSPLLKELLKYAVAHPDKTVIENRASLRAPGRR